jgi:hypothetical protein
MMEVLQQVVELLDCVQSGGCFERDKFDYQFFPTYRVWEERCIITTGMGRKPRNKMKM